MFIVLTAYLLIGLVVFFLVTMTDEYNTKKWMPTFVLTLFFWPLIFLAWGLAAMIK